MTSLRVTLVETANVLETVKRYLPRLQPTMDVCAMVDRSISKIKLALEQDVKKGVAENTELLDALQDLVDLLDEELPWVVVPDDRVGNLRIAVAILRAHRILREHHRIRIHKKAA